MQTMQKTFSMVKDRAYSKVLLHKSKRCGLRFLWGWSS